MYIYCTHWNLMVLNFGWNAQVCGSTAMESLKALGQSCGFEKKMHFILSRLQRNAQLLGLAAYIHRGSGTLGLSRPFQADAPMCIKILKLFWVDKSCFKLWKVVKSWETLEPVVKHQGCGKTGQWWNLLEHSVDSSDRGLGSQLLRYPGNAQFCRQLTV